MINTRKVATSIQVLFAKYAAAAPVTSAAPSAAKAAAGRVVMVMAKGSIFLCKLRDFILTSLLFIRKINNFC
jgi:hypothetical protein